MCLQLRVKHRKPHNRGGFKKNKDGMIIGYKVVCPTLGSVTFDHQWKKGINRSSRKDTALLEEESSQGLVAHGFHVLAALSEARKYGTSYEKIIRVLVNPKDVVATGWTNLGRYYLRTLVCTKCATDLKEVE